MLSAVRVSACHSLSTLSFIVYIVIRCPQDVPAPQDPDTCVRDSRPGASCVCDSTPLATGRSVAPKQTRRRAGPHTMVYSEYPGAQEVLVVFMCVQRALVLIALVEQPLQQPSLVATVCLQHLLQRARQVCSVLTIQSPDRLSADARLPAPALRS